MKMMITHTKGNLSILPIAQQTLRNIAKDSNICITTNDLLLLEETTFGWRGTGKASSHNSSTGYIADSNSCCLLQMHTLLLSVPTGLVLGVGHPSIQ